MTDLIQIEGVLEIKKESVADVFSDKKKLAPFIHQIKEAVAMDNPSLATAKDRKAIASNAHKVSKIKTAITKIGKESVSELKARVASVNDGVKFLEEELSNLRDETRAPLTKWEEEEKAKEKLRVDGIRDKIDGIHNLAKLVGDETLEELSNLIEAVDNIDPSQGFDEFTVEALQAVNSTKKILTDQIQHVIQKQQEEEVQAKLKADQDALDREREEFLKQKAAFEAEKALSAPETTPVNESTVTVKTFTAAPDKPATLADELYQWTSSKGLSGNDLRELTAILEKHGFPVAA